MLIGREFLSACGARSDGIAAILGKDVLAAVLVAMVVLQAKAGGGAGDHPGAGSVFADVERDSKLGGEQSRTCITRRLPAKLGVRFRNRADDPPLEALAAQIQTAAS
jgi:hypothetical protein